MPDLCRLYQGAKYRQNAEILSIDAVMSCFPASEPDRAPVRTNTHLVFKSRYYTCFNIHQTSLYFLFKPSLFSDES